MRDSGELDSSLSVQNQSLELYRELSDKYGIAACLDAIAGINGQLGRYDVARPIWQEALELFQDLDNKHASAIVVQNLGALSYRLGDYPAAYAFFNESLVARRELNDKLGLAYSLTNLGASAYRLGNCTEARRILAEALQILAELGERRITADCLAATAILLGSSGHPYEAARLFAAVEAFGDPPDPFQRQEREAGQAGARTAGRPVDEGLWRGAWQEGAKMTPGRAIEYALEELSQGDRLG